MSFPPHWSFGLSPLSGYYLTINETSLPYISLTKYVDFSKCMFEQKKEDGIFQNEISGQRRFLFISSKSGAVRQQPLFPAKQGYSA